MADQEDPKLTSSHLDVNNWQNRLLTANYREEAMLKPVGGVEAWFRAKLTCEVNHNKEGHLKHGERRGPDPTPEPQVGRQIPMTSGFENDRSLTLQIFTISGT